MAKNYICTAKGFVKGKRFDETLMETVIDYTDKVRDAQAFRSNSGTEFMKRHNIEGFIWKPFAEDAIRDMYEVKKIHHYDFEYADDDVRDTIQEWQPVKVKMSSDSDIGYLMSGKLKSAEVMTFEDAKAEALKRNIEMLSELNEKVSKLNKLVENDR